MKFDLKGNLWVAHAGNNRVLRYSAPLHTGQAADLVIGQKDFVSNNYGVGGERPSNGTLNPPVALLRHLQPIHYTHPMTWLLTQPAIYG